MVFDPTTFSSFVLFLTAWGGAFLAALWLSLVIWTYRDIRRRARDPLARILAVLVVAVLFLPRLREVRQVRRTMTARQLVFRVTRFNAFSGLLYDVVTMFRRGRE